VLVVLFTTTTLICLPSADNKSITCETAQIVSGDESMYSFGGELADIVDRLSKIGTSQS